TVQYIEKAYAAGRIPGGFIKRESKPSDFETLTSRIIDRSIRPLFPKGFNHTVQVTVMVLSTDEKADLQRIALNAASSALYASDLPVKRSVCAQRLTKIDGEFIINPTKLQLSEGTMDLYLAGTKEELLMIEMRSLGTQTEESIELPLIDPMLDPSLALQMIEVQEDNVVSESELVEAIALLQSSIFEANVAYEKAFDEIAKEKLTVEIKEGEDTTQLTNFVKENFLTKIQAALEPLAKSERSLALYDIVEEVMEHSFVIENEIAKSLVEKVVNSVKREEVRSQILDKNVRADGRKLNEVRPITIEGNVLPQSHASILFTRGQTQALAALTLGTSHDAQMYQELTAQSTQYENLMIHYNFPGFSVGEASRIGPAGRRELGHGNLAKRAITPTFDNADNKTVRIVSEILESNGSSSMATVCASSLAMKAANVNLTNLVAGVAMGLVTEGDRYAILTDIMGLEDHDGDMDFKIAGTHEGISALQMDIKLGGISLETLTEALEQAKEAREHILGIMEKSVETM
ncbi:MAG: polyribonucleotide nucleotidyltransferase, partial [Thiovulaceae bacterium]|nr:polyribonucleotide nucleotidyltransferase [Sulfurimonadaceae bacterium]